MKKFSLFALSITAVSSALISLILRLICTLCFYNGAYYDKGAILPVVADVLFILAIAVFLLASIFCVKREALVSAPRKISRYFAILPMGASVFCAAQTVTKLSLADEAEGTEFLPIAILVCSVVSAVFFFLIFYAPKQKIAATYCGLGAVALVFFAWISSYFDFSSPINSVDRDLFYVSCGAAMLFIFNEICAIYGSVKSKFYYFSIFTTIFATATSAIPALIGFANDKIDGYSNLEGDVFLTAILIYATVRVISLAKTKEASPTAPETEIAEKSEEIEQKEPSETE